MGRPLEAKELTFNPKVLNAMLIGSSIHDGYQHLFYDMGILEGVYECIHCGYKFWANSPKGKCPECGEYLSWKKLKFREVPIELDYMKGHADGILNFGKFRLLLELKSIKNVDNKNSTWGFEKLVTAPDEDHYTQAQIYLDGWRDNVLAVGDINPTNPVKNALSTIGELNGAMILYVAKNSSERKLFVVKRDPKSIKHLKSIMRKIFSAYLIEDSSGLQCQCDSLSESELKKKKCPYKGVCECLKQ